MIGRILCALGAHDIHSTSVGINGIIRRCVRCKTARRGITPKENPHA